MNGRGHPPAVRASIPDSETTSDGREPRSRLILFWHDDPCGTFWNALCRPVVNREYWSMEPAALGSNHRVLIVDDEVTIRIALRRFFMRMGWEVEEAANGEAALDLLARDEGQETVPRFSLVVSDLRMPGLNGMEMYDRLKAQHPAVIRRLVFSTGDLVSEEAASFVRSTDCVVLQKPFELATLRAVVDRVIEQNAS